MKKRSPSNDQPSARPWYIKRRKVGAGITEREDEVIVQTGPIAEEHTEDFDREVGVSRRNEFRNDFEWGTADVERSARQILDRAGLPSDPRGNFSPDGKPVQPPQVGAAIEAFVRRRGFRPHEHYEWYAAKILMMIDEIRHYVAYGEAAKAAYCAVCLGELVKECNMKRAFEQAVMKYENSRAGAARGGASKKTVAPLSTWLQQQIRQYPNKPAHFYWESLPSHDDGDRPVKVGGVDMIRDGMFLNVTYRDGRVRTLTFHSFRRYFANAKRATGTRKSTKTGKANK